MLPLASESANPSLRSLLAITNPIDLVKDVSTVHRFMLKCLPTTCFFKVVTRSYNSHHHLEEMGEFSSFLCWAEIWSISLIRHIVASCFRDGFGIGRSASSQFKQQSDFERQCRRRWRWVERGGWDLDPGITFSFCSNDYPFVFSPKLEPDKKLSLKQKDET